MAYGMNLTIGRYDFERSIDFAIPFHAACHHLLGEVLWHWGLLGSEKEVDYHILYRTLFSFADKGSELKTSLSRLDYGDIDSKYDQIWYPQSEDKRFVLSPLAPLPELEAYFQNPPLRRRNGQKNITRDKAHSMATGIGTDPFANLASELLFLIMMHLPVSSIDSFRSSSLAAAQLPLHSGFWKPKLRHDMPWVPELPGHLNGQLQEEVNWFHIYIDLESMCRPGSTRSIDVLVNRRRIWKTCEQVATSYASNRAVKSSGSERDQDSILANAVTTMMQPLAWPVPARFDTFSLPFIEQISDIEHNRPTLSVFWSNEGTLSGLGVRDNHEKSTEPRETIGQKDCLASRNDVEIAQDDWIIGFVLVFRGEHRGMGVVEKRIVGMRILFLGGNVVQCGESTGDLKLFHAQDNLLIIGIMAHVSFEGQISALSLLQSSVSNSSPYAARLARHQSDLPYARSDIGSKMWKDHLPPPGIHAGEPHLVQFIPAVSIPIDPVPMEPLFFGHDQEELASITEIAGDLKMAWFEVRYSDRPSRRIGPGDDDSLRSQESLKIDGHGGERIVAINILVGTKWLNSVRLMTNRGRSLFLGTGSGHVPDKLVPPHEGLVLCGMYASWTEPLEPESALEVIGGLFFSPPAGSSSSDFLEPDTPDGEPGFPDGEFDSADEEFDSLDERPE